MKFDNDLPIDKCIVDEVLGVTPNASGRPRHPRIPDFREAASLGVAVCATGTSIAMSTTVGWQRGATTHERTIWIAMSVLMVLAVHLLPALTTSLEGRVRSLVTCLWFASLVFVCSSHATYFLFMQMNTGEARAHAIDASETALPFPAAPKRSATSVARDIATRANELSAIQALRCITGCAAKKRDVSLVRRELEALQTEADEIRRYNAEYEARRRDERALREAKEDARQDPLTGPIARCTGLTQTTIDLCVGLISALLLEGLACLCWLLAFKSRARCAGADPTGHVSPARAVPHPQAEAESTLPPLTHLPPKSRNNRSELDQILAAISAKEMRGTVADIRRLLRCSQSRAQALRRLI